MPIPSCDVGRRDYGAGVTRPNLDDDGWRLDSAVDRHNDAPATFRIPPAEVRESLKIGDLAKLLFHLRGSDDDGRPSVTIERMWVTVTEVTDAGYIGRLESTPRTSAAVAPGDLVPFAAEHVAAVEDY